MSSYLRDNEAPTVIMELFRELLREKLRAAIKPVIDKCIDDAMREFEPMVRTMYEGYSQKMFVELIVKTRKEKP